MRSSLDTLFGRQFEATGGQQVGLLHHCTVIGLAVLINGLLFLLMPTLLQQPANKALLPDIAAPFDVIRLPKPDSPVKKQEEKPPEPPPEQPPPEPTPPRPVLSKPKLPFAVNPRLPDGPSPLSLPVDMADVSFSGGGDFFTAADLDAPLLVTTRIPPVYPNRARHRKIEGWVRVQFIVNEDGRVSEVKVMESQPTGIFETSVLAAVAGWRFRAGTVAGVPVKARAETTVRFQLDK